jgi:signal recognition particle subunit SRP54
MDRVQALGPMSKVIQMIPGMDEATKQMDIGEGAIEAQFGRMRAIYCSMTNGERVATEVLNGARRSRIAAGAGVHTREVSAFLRQFEMSREMMDRLRRP